MAERQDGPSEGGGSSEEGGGSGNESKSMILDQDRFLPIANVARIMKREVPDSGKIAKDAKECVQECVSEFIAFVASEASERCLNEKRKTINGDDVLVALRTLGFDAYLPSLTAYLHKYREAQKGTRDVSATGEETAPMEANPPSVQQQPVIYIDPAQLAAAQGAGNGQPVLVQTPGGGTTLQFVQLVQQPPHSTS